jgi:hypothetical protein
MNGGVSMSIFHHKVRSKPEAPAVARTPRPVTLGCRVQYDQNGLVSTITAPPQGTWASKHQGPATYYSRSAGSLLDATEILKQVGSIPGMTYYVVDTPDGSLGRDINGYYTESPLKTQGLTVASRSTVPGTVEFSSLRGQGHDQQEMTAAAALKKSGKYARFILMMECGRCGYRSPVETQAGSLVRECYCCGTKNSGIRGTISMVMGPGSTVEILSGCLCKELRQPGRRDGGDCLAQSGSDKAGMGIKARHPVGNQQSSQAACSHVQLENKLCQAARRYPPTVTLCNRHPAIAMLRHGPVRGPSISCKRMQPGPLAARLGGIRAGSASGAPGDRLRLT